MPYMDDENNRAGIESELARMGFVREFPISLSATEVQSVGIFQVDLYKQYFAASEEHADSEQSD